MAKEVQNIVLQQIVTAMDSALNSLMLHIRIILSEEVHTLSQLCLSNTVIILYTPIQHNIVTSFKIVPLHNLGMIK